MEQVTLILGSIGTATGVGALAFAWLSWRRAGTALEENRRSPVRAAQHALLVQLEDQSTQLQSLLTNDVNNNVQSYDHSIVEQNARLLRELVGEMTAPGVVDRKLGDDLATLRKLVFSDLSDPRNSLADMLDQVGSLIERVARARENSEQMAADELMNLGSQHRSAIDTARSLNGTALELTRKIRSRVRQLELEGLGDLSKSRIVSKGE